MREPLPELRVGGVAVPPGSAVDVEIEVARLPTRTRLTLPVRVVRGLKAGPAVSLSAAIHGDELNGIEIVRRVLAEVSPKRLRGTLLATPIVNLHGFLSQSRYLPDGRDLNRVFPGSAKGSLAASLANLFMTEVVGKCTHGIDLHTGSNHRTNLPQIRADLEDPETRACALAFGAPVAIHARVRDGSLREAAARRGIRILLFEGGQSQRFDQKVIEAGVRGVLGVLHHLGMRVGRAVGRAHPLSATKSSWTRAPRSGLLRLRVAPGDEVRKRESVGTIANAFGEGATEVRAHTAGIVVGATLNPVVHRGDAVIHIAVVGSSAAE